MAADGLDSLTVARNSMLQLMRGDIRLAIPHESL